MRVRLMCADDLASAERASALTFLDAERSTRRVSEPEAEPRSAVASKQWIDRTRFSLSVDPGGCWVAVEEGTGADGVVGFAMSQNRGGLWYLATYGVLPGHQAQGIGKRLMDAVLAHADGRPGIFSSSVHAGAPRRYRLAGFSLHPQMRMAGTVDRSTLPAVDGLREGRAGDFEWMDRLDRQLRVAGHGPDHGYMLGAMRLAVSRDMTKPG
ncbi:GNAT family N-acetyltransferase [Streptomyces sp. NPDC059922]|uniref:GNAT family N-acetyltransferase n=2 Tax=unclassified Streptomyces TaxID=2593676 RepID=UPI00364FBBD5